MTRCAICHDQTDDAPTCGAETCEVAWACINAVANATNLAPYKHRFGGRLCYFCEAAFHNGETHADDCEHKRAAALVASRGTEDTDG